MTLHLVAYPHTRLDGGFDTCAYTQKVVRFRRLAVQRDLIIYGTAGADVVLLDEDERATIFGPDDPACLPTWPLADQWSLLNERAIMGIRERAEKGDLLLLAGGQSQQKIPDSLALTVVEPFVGYEGILPASARAFESHAHRHYVYGKSGIADGCWLDTVIPNFFDPDDFPQAGYPSRDYLLFLGRVTLRKGVEVAQKIARAVGMPLIVAGPGGRIEFGQLVGDYLSVDADGIDYVGTVGPVERAELLANARALLAPTLYLEPFGGVAVEAQMCGTPVIAPPFGAFPETVVDGETGFLVSTIAEGAAAVAACEALDHIYIAERARYLFSLDAIGPRFARWFDRIETVMEHGWYAVPEESRGLRG
jgi:glycosyltransferase involved in cell wall biosynthesis